MSNEHAVVCGSLERLDTQHYEVLVALVRKISKIIMNTYRFLDVVIMKDLNLIGVVTVTFKRALGMRLSRSEMIQPSWCIQAQTLRLSK